MTPQERLALALEYQRKQSDPLDTVPVAGVKQPLTPNEMTWMDRLNNMSAGLGKGIEGQLEGYKQLVTQPVQSAKDTVQALGTMVKNPSVIVDALKGMGEKAASGAQGLGEVVGENMTLNPRKLAMALANPRVAELTVYHGTPHTFPAAEGAPLGKFDASKIGTGEGAQAYGHGIYVAENPDVAKGYRVGLTSADRVGPFRAGFAKIGDMPAKELGQDVWEVADVLASQNIGIDKYIANLQRRFEANKNESSQKVIQELIEQAKKVEPHFRGKNVWWDEPGSLYTVDLPDEHIEKMLDWDKPLSEQEIGKTFKLNVSKNPDPLPNEQWVVEIDLNGNKKSVNAFKTKKAATEYVNSATGGDLYKSLEPYTGPANVSQQMRELGIPGIKYLDAGSRDGGKGTRNFVIFPGEEHNLKILERK